MQLLVCELILYVTEPDEPSLWRMTGKHAGLACYTIQLMHYSQFKTHSLQHLKPIKC
jgi:hypothetical protein